MEERYENVSVLGVVSSLFGLDRKIVGKFLAEGVGKKHPEYLEPNLKALETGFLWAKENGGNGCSYSEGGNRFISAIRRNVDVTMIVHDKQVYGLTKGQDSST